MIAFTATTKDGGRVVGLGLQHGNLQRLQQNQPILVRLKDLNLDYPVEVLLYFADSPAAAAWLGEQTVEASAVHADAAPEHLGERLGPMGKRPFGQIARDDAGETRFAVGHADRRVVIDFGAPTRWIGLDKETAMRLIDALREHAAHAD